MTIILGSMWCCHLPVDLMKNLVSGVAWLTEDDQQKAIPPHHNFILIKGQLSH